MGRVKVTSLVLALKSGMMKGLWPGVCYELLLVLPNRKLFDEKTQGKYAEENLGATFHLILFVTN